MNERGVNDFGVDSTDVGCSPTCKRQTCRAWIVSVIMLGRFSRWFIKLSNTANTVWCSARYNLARYTSKEHAQISDFQFSEEIIDGDLQPGQNVHGLKAHRLWIETEGGTDWELGSRDKTNMTSARPKPGPWSPFAPPV